MVGIFSKNFRAFLLAAAALSCVSARAKDPVFPPTPPGFKMGMEVELTPDRLANLMHYFDFDQLEESLTGNRAKLFSEAKNTQQKLAPELGDLSKSYLRNNPSAFWSLPKELRAELSLGLTLKSVLLQKRTGLLGADAKPMQKNAGLLLPGIQVSGAPAREAISIQSPKLIISETGNALSASGVVDEKLFQSSGSLQVSNTVDWEKLISRWEALPEVTRNGSVRLGLLPPQEKAFLFYACVADKGESLPQMGLKKDLGEKELKFWSKLSWKPDQDSVEFVHSEPVDSPQEFLSDLRAFGQRAGVERELFDPERAELNKVMRDEKGNIFYENGKPIRKAKPWGSFHYHFSFKEKDLRPFAEEINFNLFVHRLAKGITSDLTGGGDHTFRGTTSRGLMRLLALNHLEIRNHLDTLEEELSRQLIPLFSKTPAEAVQTIRADTQSVLSDDVVRKLAASSWHDKLKNFQYNYGPVIQQLETEVAETGATQEAVKALAYLKPRSSAFSNYLQHFLANTAYSQGAIHDDFLILLNEWLRGGEDHTHPVRAQISRLLRSAAPDEVGFALVRMNSDSWILPPTEVERLELLKFLERLKRGEFSGSAWENRVLHFGAKFYRGDKNFLPVLENMLKSTPMPYARKGIEGYLAENFQGDREVFQRFGPLLLQLPASATAVQMQRAATSRLGFRLDRPERMAVTETLLSFGKLSPSAMKDFLAFYDPKDLPAADDLRLIYRLGEFHPELRARALKDILFAAESGNVSSLDIIAEFGIREPAILRAIRAFGDEGNTELAKKVRSILEFASATAACQVNFTKVAKRKR